MPDAPCRSGDLRISAEPAGAATGHLSQPFVLTDIGTAGCVLAGYPKDLQGRQSGSWHEITVTQGTFFYVEPATPQLVVLQPGTSAELIVGTSDGCNGGISDGTHRYSRLRMVLPDGDSVELDAAIDGFCGVSVSSFHPLPVPQSPAPTPTPKPFDVLQVSMRAPEQAVAGTVIDYTVTLTNPTDHDVALTPCPAWQGLIDVPTGPNGLVKVEGVLDCAATPSIPAGKSITLPMSIRAPTAYGPAKFVWWLSDMTSGAGEPLTIVAGR